MIIQAKWPWPSLKGHRQVNIEYINVENIPVKFQKDLNIHEKVIVLTT